MGPVIRTNSKWDPHYTIEVTIISNGFSDEAIDAWHLSKSVSFAGTAPSFDQPLSSELARLGGTVTLECVVKGEPQPNIEW